MPYKKTYAKRAPKRNYKKTYKKKYTPSYVPKNQLVNTTIMNRAGPQVMRFTRTAQYVFTQQSGSAYYNDFKMLTFQLDALPSYTEFTSMFSKYRISKIDLRLSMVDTVGDTTAQPICYMWRNYNIALSAPTLSKITQLPNVKQTQLSNENRVVTISMVPYNIVNIFSGAYKQSYNEWIDLAYPSVSYYGIGIFIENLSQQSIGTQQINYDVTYHVECKSEN